MAHLIDKSALVAEIENLESTYKKCPTSNSYEEGLKDGRLIGYKDALYKIDTLEVKEVQEESTGDIEACQSRLGKSNGYLAEPVSEKKCMYTEDHYTDEDRKILCDGCEEECEYAQKKEPVSDDLEDTINCYIADNFFGSQTLGFFSNRTKEEPNDQDIALAIKAGAKWQKEQMMKYAIEATVKMDARGYPYIHKTIELYDYDKDEPLAKAGDKVKIVLIKEE